jgi:hypothetical protein
MKSQDYIDILRIHLLPLATELFGNNAWYLQQDNATCHTSNLTREAMHSMNIRVLPWPANSPDMNCIENAWGLLKRKLYQYNSGFTRDDVIRNALDIFHNDSQFRDTCIHLILSMPKRVQKLFNVKGGFTGY